MNQISQEDVKRVKGKGFLRNKDTNRFSCRVITENGVLNVQQMQQVTAIAERYGNGDMAFTSRMTVELPGINYEDIETVIQTFKEAGLATGGTGSKIRPIVSCKGTTCHYGLADTQAFATLIHSEFYEKWNEVVLPHKFKIAVGGCPNNCVKPDLNDFGIVGQHVVTFNEDSCKGCLKCAIETTCPMKAAKVVDHKLNMDPKLCSHCGLCVTRCPFKAITPGQYGFRIYVGGKWGKFSRPGSPIQGVYSQEEVLVMLEKALLLYRKYAYVGERFGNCIDRVGLEKFEALLLSDEVLNEKEAILLAPINLAGK